MGKLNLEQKEKAHFERVKRGSRRDPEGSFQRFWRKLGIQKRQKKFQKNDGEIRLGISRKGAFLKNFFGGSFLELLEKIQNTKEAEKISKKKMGKLDLEFQEKAHF